MLTIFTTKPEEGWVMGYQESRDDKKSLHSQPQHLIVPLK